jgi:hypothetical protein
MIGNAISWFLVERAGQRPLMFYGICSLTVDLILTDARVEREIEIPTQI